MSYAANNPFVSDPQSRYPDLSGSLGQDPSTAQYTQWLQPSAQSPSGFQSQQQPPFMQQQQQQFQPQQYSSSYPPQQGFTPQSPTQFQPTSSFGQQLQGSSYGYLQGQSTVQSPGAYNPVQQQLQQNPGYIAQFDPYASIGQGWDGTSPQQQQQQQPPSQTPSSPGGFFTSASASPTSQVHPREYIRVHKAEIESWDTYAWKQLLNRFDALKDAWEARKIEIEGHVSRLQQQMQFAGYQAGQLQQEIGRLQAMAKDAGYNFDSVAASSFQMHEVFTNYRQSGDLASKQRVREASNAALASLPDWPPLAY